MVTHVYLNRGPSHKSCQLISSRPARLRQEPEPPPCLVPDERSAAVIESSISWNYTIWLNILFLVVAAVLIIRFVRSNGVPMLRMMGGSPSREH